MKTITKTLYLVVIMALFLACEEKKVESELSVNPETLNFTAEGGNVTFSISSNTSWTVSTDNSNVSVTPASGSDDGTVRVTVSASNSIEQQSYRILVKTNDGSVQKNVTVKQDGRYIAKEVTLKVTNYSDMVLFGGKAQDLDSLRILSNVPWQIKGPEWVEAWNGSRWVALSQQRATVQGDETTGQDAEGTKILRLRTTSGNYDTNNRSDVITITPTYEGKEKVEIIAFQLGKYSVAPNVTIALSDGLATDFECGNDVNSFVVTISEKRLEDSEITVDNIQKYWDFGQPGEILGWGNLKENTLYYMTMIGVGKDGVTLPLILDTGFSTGTSVGQALTTIVDPQYKNGTWKWSTKINENTKGYYMWVTENSNFFSVTNAILAWFMNYYTHDEELLKTTFKQHYANESFSYTTENHVLLATWSAGHNENYVSYLIDRYCSYDGVKASSRIMAPMSDKPVFSSCPLDLKAFRESFSVIKVK